MKGKRRRRSKIGICKKLTLATPPLQVEVEVESSDKGGNFIGWLYFEGKNLSVSLVTEGLSKVLPHAERSVHAKDLFEAEEKARAAKKKIWKVRTYVCVRQMWRMMCTYMMSNIMLVY